jgi:CBS domain-containing membrane protein
MISEQFALVDAIEQMCAGKKIGFRPIRTAGDIMTTDVKTLTLDHTVKAFLDFMMIHKVRHVPVVDFHDEDKRNPYFAGIVSQRDVLRLTLPYAGQIGGQAIDRKALRQLLAQIVARKPKSASPDTPVPAVITTMINNHIGMIPVIADSNLVGIITTTDIVKLYTKLDAAIHKLYPELGKQTRPAKQAWVDSPEKSALFSWVFQTVREIMTKNAVCLRQQDELAEAMKVMQKHKFRHLPILDEHDKLVGIVSDRDILQQLPFAGRRPPSEPKAFRAYLFKVDPKSTSLQLPMDRIMTRKTANVSPDLSVCEAAKMLRKSKIDCLLVLDERENTCGIVTVTDLMRSLLEVYKPTEEPQP